MPEEKLDELRRMIEELDDITEIDDETRELIETKWPWLIAGAPASTRMEPSSKAGVLPKVTSACH